LTTGVPIQ